MWFSDPLGYSTDIAGFLPEPSRPCVSSTWTAASKLATPLYNRPPEFDHATPLTEWARSHQGGPKRYSFWLPEFLGFCFKKNWVHVENNPFHRFPWMVWWSWKSEKVEWISLLHHISGWMKEVCTGWEKWEREHLAFQRLGCNLLESKGWRRWWQCWTQIVAIIMHHHHCHDVSSWMIF